ncbi:putative asparagine synthase [Mycena polygramma]|nr:putative asparagine synthase [Mycena polygramma]
MFQRAWSKVDWSAKMRPRRLLAQLKNKPSGGHNLKEVERYDKIRATRTQKRNGPPLLSLTPSSVGRVAYVIGQMVDLNLYDRKPAMDLVEVGQQLQAVVRAVYHGESLSPPSGVRALLEASLENIQHRGPDNTGTWVSSDSRVGLGHVRLSIIDLETGQQPLFDEDGVIHCVVTGEIYDHERIRQELEVQGSVYKHYGSNLFSNLRGEFAFVLYDSTRRVLFAARDRFGIKPLYYTISDGRLLVASEMKAFLPFRWKAEWDIDSVVQNGGFNDDRTVFKGVNKVSGQGIKLIGWIVNGGAFSAVSAHWIPQNPEICIAIPATAELSIPPLRYAPTGTSECNRSLIASKSFCQYNACDLLFPDAGNNDEGPIAHRTATFIGAEEHMVKITEVELVDALEDTIWHVEQPIWSFHGPGKFLLSKFTREQGYKVVLSGEGADEFFGGYARLPVDYFRQPDPAGIALGLDLPSDAERAAILHRIQFASAVPVLSLGKNSYTDSQLARKMLGGISTHRGYAAAGSAGPEVYNSSALAVAGLPDVPRAIAEGIDPRVRDKAVSGQWHPLNVALYVSAKTILQQVILNHMGERVEMAHSVEGRPPFLDHYLVNFASTTSTHCPVSMLYSNLVNKLNLGRSVKVRPVKGDTPGAWSFTDKWILRQAVKPYVLGELFLRKKLSYNAPPARRPEGEHGTSALVPLQAHLKVRLTRATVERVGIFQWSFVEESLASYLAQPNFPADGALDSRAQLLMYVLSFIVLQERFSVPTWNP